VINLVKVYVSVVYAMVLAKVMNVAEVIDVDKMMGVVSVIAWLK
jgi:hypothetical protein